ncbi:YvrJ family protein [Bacillus massiliglaciei]|uniref:YvrJ family protein n=1 Tax=Bacillus massiliglaciei TaxID=1816693 RepID=UPI000DA6255C|nr:YvrJ family protein [Bacillus massiliglaciei]
MMEEAAMWMSLVSEFGYPLIISTFLLFRFEKKLRELALDVEKVKNASSRKRR